MISPTYVDVKTAADRLADHAVRTPLLVARNLSERLGAEIWMKAENLQRTNSFKFRGAYNAIALLSEDDRQKGVVAASSGNHAQGVAAAAQLFGISATIIMPSDAPVTKIDRTKALGAQVVFYDRENQDRDTLMHELGQREGRPIIPPYNHSDVIAGQGTVGLEIAQDMNAMGKAPDRVLVCTGGGGLTAGVALAIHHYFPNTIIHSCEPEGFDDYARSLKAGQPQKNERSSGSICDAILTNGPGSIGFEINHKLLSEGLVFRDQDALNAMRYAFNYERLVLEPGGAAALASVMVHGENWKGETVVVVLSGGNVDRDIFQRAIQSD